MARLWRRVVWYIFISVLKETPASFYGLKVRTPTGVVNFLFWGWGNSKNVHTNLHLNRSVLYSECLRAMLGFSAMAMKSFVLGAITSCSPLKFN
jgi:hypothetical protein